MKLTRLASMLLAGILSLPALSQADSFVQLALWPPNLQIVDETESITGFRLQIFGRNADVSGLDFGLAHHTTGEFSGVGIGFFNFVDGDAYGIQWSLAGGAITKGDFYGWQNGVFNYIGGAGTGFQHGLVEYTGGEFGGVQLGVYQQTGQDIYGMQLGVVNVAGGVEGIQFGLINLTDDMNGIQIGLWNQINNKEGWMKIFPFVNWNF